MPAPLPVQTVWIQHPGFDFLDARMSDVVPRSRVQLYESVKASFTSLAGHTTSEFNPADYRRVVGNLICSLVADKHHAVFAERIFGGDCDLFGHSANVAYLSLLIGMRLRPYIASQRRHVAGAQAEDLTNLGLGAMFHDVGKLAFKNNLQAGHIIDLPDSDPDYQTHPEKGYRALRERIEATAAAVILHHHQHFNGRGFPAPKKKFKERQLRPLAGQRIHIFARVVAAANLIDSLVTAFQKQNQPMVAALWALQNEPYVGMLDPVILHAALQCIPPFPLGTCLTLADGRDAVVVDLNESVPCRPKVRILIRAGLSAQPGEEIDLAEPNAPAIARQDGQPVTAFLNWKPPAKRNAAANPQHRQSQHTLA